MRRYGTSTNTPWRTLKHPGCMDGIQETFVKDTLCVALNAGALY